MENLRCQHTERAVVERSREQEAAGTLPTQIREATEIRPLALGTRPASRGLPIVHGTQA